MQHMAMAIVGLACLTIGAFSIFMLAPREGRLGVRWMEVEFVAILVILVLLILVSLGAALLVTALA
jgi:hypothetical protein